MTVRDNAITPLRSLPTAPNRWASSSPHSSSATSRPATRTIASLFCLGSSTRCRTSRPKNLQLGMPRSSAQLAARVQQFEDHQCLFKTFDVRGVVVQRLPFYKVLNEHQSQPRPNSADASQNTSGGVRELRTWCANSAVSELGRVAVAVHMLLTCVTAPRPGSLSIRRGISLSQRQWCLVDRRRARS